MVRTDSSVVGIEVTEIHQQSQRNAPVRRGQESERKRLVWEAEREAKKAGLPIVDVSVRFNPHYQVRKRDRQNLVQRLVAVVADNIPPVGESTTLQNQMDAGPSPQCFGDVRIYRSSDLTKHHWSVPEAGYVMEDFQTELQDA